MTVLFKCWRPTRLDEARDAPMPNGISKRQKEAEELRKKRARAAHAWPEAAAELPKAVRVPSAAPRLPAVHYPVLRRSLGKRQGGGSAS
jgi:hypothetical protein